MSKCQILISCPHLEIDKPCQFENGLCPHQRKVVDLAIEMNDEDNKHREGVSAPLSIEEINKMIDIVKDFNKAYEEDGYPSRRQELLDRSIRFIDGIYL